jgi:aspartate kinase
VRENVVTGIAGKKDFTIITVEKSLMNAEVGFVGKVLSVIGKREISFEHLPSGVDTMSLVIDNDYLKGGVLNEVVEEMRESVNPDKLYVHQNIALIAIVGRGMVKNIGTSARVFKAIADAGININMIDQGSSELNIIVGVENDDLAPCIKALYNEFFN